MTRPFPQVRILADDLSGAADCAASFTGAAGRIRLLLDAPAQPPSASFALDCDTRWREPAEAARIFRSAAAGLASRDAAVVIYKKIDSTLRGPVAAELAAFASLAPQGTPVVVAPAFPAQGRALVEGRVWVRGMPPAGDVDSLADSVAAALGDDGEVIALASVAGFAPRAARRQVLVIDAGSDEELASIARAARAWPTAAWFAGSAGLARALAGVAPRRVEPGRGPALVVVGSFAQASRAQAEALAMRDPAAVMAWTPGEPDAPLLAAAMHRLRAGRDVLVRLVAREVPVGAGSRALAHALAARLAALVPHAGTLVLAGGDTARAVLQALGVDALEIEGEFEPGIAVASPLRPGGPAVVLKAGGFGDNGLFARLVARLAPSSSP